MNDPDTPSNIASSGASAAIVPASFGPPPSDPAVRQRDYLLRVAQALSADLDLPAVLGRVIRAAVNITGGYAGAIALGEREGDLQVVASYRLEERFEHFLEPYLQPAPGARVDDAGEVGDEADEAEPPLGAAGAGALVIPTPSDPAGVAAFDVPGGPDEGWQVLTLPVARGDATSGRIFVFRSEGAAAFTPLDGELLKTFADQAAVAIHNAETHRRLVTRERRLAALVEHSPAGSLLVGADGRVITANPAALALAGRAEAAVVGVPLAQTLRLENERGQPLAVPLPEGDEAATLQGRLRRADGGPAPFVQVAVTPLPGAGAAAAGFVVDVVDLSGFKAAEDAKRAFLAGLSHELKTPLALIRGFAETLVHAHVRADEALADEALKVILDETEHLTRMVEQLLLAARLEAGALALAWHTVDLAGELARAVDAFRGLHPDRAWTLSAADLPPIEGDPTRLREVFHNLLTNAVKYSEPGTPIAVEAEPAADGSAVEIRFRDAGVGIAAADQARVFERFVRATDRGDGAGLGLYMTRAIVEAHGGRVDVASAPGRGSTFSVTLPSAPALAPAMPPAAREARA